MNTRVLLTLLVPAAVGLGCGDPMTATTPTFTSLKPTITNSCALSTSCHKGSGASIDLQADPYKALVGAATQAPLYPKLKADFPTLVVAGDAAKSSCYVKMTLAAGHDANYGDRMPQSALPLDAATLANFKAWINGGAKND